MEHLVTHDPETDLFMIHGTDKWLTAGVLAKRLEYLSGLGHEVLFDGHAFTAFWHAFRIHKPKPSRKA